MDAMTRREIYFDAAGPQQWEKLPNGEYKSKQGYRLVRGNGKKWVLIDKKGNRHELKEATFPGAEKAIAEIGG